MLSGSLTHSPLAHSKLAWDPGSLPGSRYYNLTTAATRMSGRSESQMSRGQRRGRTCGMEYPGLTSLLLFLLLGTMEANPYGVQEYCEGERFIAKCERDEAIIVQSAFYGRMRLGRCVRMNMGYIGCEANALDVADKKCSGRHQCEIKIPDDDMEKSQPCFELKSYLEIAYTCVRVARARPSVCQTAKYVKLTSGAAYLSSRVTQETGCGSTLCPWVIEVLPGQRVNVTLIDFAWQSRSGGADLSTDTLQICQKYAIIREMSQTKSVTVCGSAKRESHVFTSTSHELEVYLTPKASPDGHTNHFLLKYEAFGCPNLVPPPNAVFRRRDDEGVVRCKYSGQTWKLQCKGNTWMGSVGNCSHFEPRRSGQFVIGSVQMPHGIAVAIVAGVAIVIGMLIVTIGLVIFKRNYRVKGSSGSGGGGSGRSRPSRGRHYPEGRDEYLGQTERCLPGLPGLDDTLTGPLKCPLPGHHNNGNKNDYTHIWERPLPIPNEVQLMNSSSSVMTGGTGTTPGSISY